MNFTRVDGFLSVSRITGPKHNLLQVKLDQGPRAVPRCDRLPAIGSCRHEPLNESELISRILEGVSMANEELGTKYCVTHIRYIENDTKPEVVYGSMVLNLTRHLECGGEFNTGAVSSS